MREQDIKPTAMFIKRKPKSEEKLREEREEEEKMRELFTRLWNREGKLKWCWSCGKRIYGSNSRIYWHHLLPKEQWPEYKYEEANIYFCCADCHTSTENGYPPEKIKQAVEEAKKKFL